MDFAAWTKAAIAEHRLIHGDPAAGERLGRFDRARLEQHLEHLQAIDLLDEMPQLEEVFAFDLLRELGY